MPEQQPENTLPHVSDSGSAVPQVRTPVEAPQTEGYTLVGDPFAVGDMAGNYRILKLLSGGGMGAVYLA